MSHPAHHADGVLAPHSRPYGPGHGPYWYGFYWHYHQRTKSFYVGKVLPADAEVLPDPASPSAGPSDSGATKGREDMGNM